MKCQYKQTSVLSNFFAGLLFGALAFIPAAVAFIYKGF